MGDFPANPTDKPGYVLEFAEDFRGPAVDEQRWVPYYCPHWASRARSRARTGRRDGRLVLEIGADQPPWSEEWDGQLRASVLQTGLFSGPVGSDRGQLRFRDDLVVREAQPTVRTYTPRYAFVELRAQAVAAPEAMVALWLMGFEDEPERSGEICIAEIFGSSVTADRAEVGMGIHPFGDPRLREEWRAEPVELDATEFHVYAVDWRSDRVDFFIDNQLVKTAHQAPAYAMQLMLAIYQFPDRIGTGPAHYPQQFVVDYVRGYRPLDAPGQPHGVPGI